MEDADWQSRFDAALDMTRRIAADAGWPFKEPVEIVFGPCNWPTWTSLSSVSGRVRMQPPRDDPEAIAHELGHGIHEVLRVNPKYSARLHDLGNDPNGEQFAQMIRRRVEKLLNHTFHVNQDAEMYDQWGDDWEGFVAWVDGNPDPRPSTSGIAAFARESEGLRAT